MMNPTRKSGRIQKKVSTSTIHKLLAGGQKAVEWVEPVAKVAKVAMPEKGGYGVVSTGPIHKGDFVCEYKGDLLSVEVAKAREREYAEEDSRAGVEKPMCYMYFLDKKRCIDATKTDHVGRLINHSRLRPNIRPKLFVVDGVPRLAFVAIADIAAGTELMFDYGDRSPETLKTHPWLRL